MKLTNYHRDAFIHAVMNDVPKITKEEVQPKVQEALVKAMSPEARKLYREAPKALTSDYSFDLTTDRCCVSFVVGDADKDTVLAPFFEAVKKHEAVKDSLRATIYSCSTLKQAKDRLPEFEKYLPSEAGSLPASANLPVVANLVADLTNLGWPKKGA